VPSLPFAAGDLPLPTSIPPWMGLAIIGFWVAIVVIAVRVLRLRRALRAERLQQERPRVTRAHEAGLPSDRQLGAGEERPPQR
jgi:hypothetical protein